MIISGGENVYSVEVENVLSTHPAVREVAVIGVPDERWGEAVKAIVVLNEGNAVSAEELIQFCGGRIAGYKIPKSVDFSAEPLPKTGPGKIAKAQIARSLLGRPQSVNLNTQDRTSGHGAQSEYGRRSLCGGGRLCGPDAAAAARAWRQRRCLERHVA